MDAPQPEARWSPTGQGTTPQLANGYRWIAVRPGAPPPPRRRRRPLGPTPRYTDIPRWGLADPGAAAGGPQGAPHRPAPSTALLRATLLATMLALGIAAVLHLVRYVLLVINRDTLLHPLVAAAGLWLPTLASVAATLTTAGCAVLLTRWLIARRAAAFAHRARPDSRPAAQLWLGCVLPVSCALVAAQIGAILLSLVDHPISSWVITLVLVGCLLPLLGLVWALVYVIELARTENHYIRLRKPIWVWWSAAMSSAAVSVFATLTSFARDAQGIANNTAAAAFAYVLALGAIAGAARLFGGFERRPVERPAHRWVVVADDGQAPSASEPARTADASLEPESQEPAA